MRICFVNLLYALRHRRGGLGEHIADMSQAFARRGHDVTVLTSGAPGESHEGSVRVVRLGPLEPFARRAQLLNPSYTLDRLRYFWRVRQHIAAGGYDIVEAADGGFEQLLPMWNRSATIVTKLHGNFRQFHPQPTLLQQAMHTIESATVRGSDAIYASSSAHAAVASDDYRVSPDRIAIVPCGIDVAALEAARQSHRIAEIFPATRGRRIVLLSVGASPGRKGARIFAEAAAARPWGDALFVLLTADRGFLAGLPQSANLLVLPPQEKSVFRALVAAASVVTFPSSFESFSIATHEAMLLGRHLIVSQHIPLDSPARDYTLMTVLDTLDVAAWSSAIQRALAADSEGRVIDASEQQRLRAAYGIDHVVDATLALYRKAQAGRARTPAASGRGASSAFARKRSGGPP